MQTQTASSASPPAEPAPSVIRIDGATRRFGAVTAIEGLSLTVRSGEVVAVVGPSGCGKSTLLELVCGLAAPDAGRVEAGPAALMPQRDLLLPWASALDNAALAVRLHGASKTAARAVAAPVFAQFGLTGFERSRPGALSGGMRQRVAFLRTLLAGKPILCLDEPFASLDALSRAEMQTWLADALAREPRTVMLVTHDVEEAVLLADRVAVMSPRPGRIVAEVTVTPPRPRVATDATIVALRGRAIEALAAGARGSAA